MVGTMAMVGAVRPIAKMAVPTIRRQHRDGVQSLI